jgi:hypothetical protein
MPFLHIHLVLICYSFTYIWFGYVIPPHASGPNMSFLHIHTSRSDMSFLHTHLVRICHSSTPIWSGYVIPPYTYIWSGYVIPQHASGPDM